MSDDIENNGVVLGTTSGMKMMADGTIRISFDFEPRHGQQAFALFGSPGSQVAVARILQEVAQRQAQRETAAPEKGGALCKLAGIFCNNEDFRTWLSLAHDPVPSTAEDAAEIIRRTCHIFSRSELDHNAEAAATFHREFRLPYSAWADGRRA